FSAIVARFAHRSWEERYSACNVELNGLQHGILRMLRSKTLTLSELSRKFMLDPSTLVPVIDSLARQGYIKRGKDPNDRRRVPLRITEYGTSTIDSISFVAEEDLLFQILTEMGETKATALAALLREIVQLMPDGGETLRAIDSRIQLHTIETNP